MNAIGKGEPCLLHEFEPLSVDRAQGAISGAFADFPPSTRTLEDSISIGLDTPEVETDGMALKVIGQQGRILRFRTFVIETLVQQGRMVRLAGGDGPSGLHDVTGEGAKELIGFDGYYGVEQSSARIAELAVSLLSESPEKFDIVMLTIFDGFSDAETALDGVLLEINYKTLDSIQAMVTEWMGGFLPPEG